MSPASYSTGARSFAPPSATVYSPSACSSIIDLDSLREQELSRAAACAADEITRLNRELLHERSRVAELTTKLSGVDQQLLVAEHMAEAPPREVLATLRTLSLFTVLTMYCTDCAECECSECMSK
jgi:hypothetical protein